MSGWKIIKEADDILAIRLSVGEPRDYPEQGGYIVYRGDKEECLRVLKQAVKELESE